MALPKKGLRKITVSDFKYAWSATGNDDFISLTIAPLWQAGQLLSTAFGYHSTVIEEIQMPDGTTIRHGQQRLRVTPFLVRQIIEYALRNGWQPEGKGQFYLPEAVERVIDLRLPALR